MKETQVSQTGEGNAPRKYWSETGSLITKEQWEDEQAAKFPAFARDLAARRATESELQSERGQQ